MRRNPDDAASLFERLLAAAKSGDPELAEWLVEQEPAVTGLLGTRLAAKRAREQEAAAPSPAIVVPAPKPRARTDWTAADAAEWVANAMYQLAGLPPPFNEMGMPVKDDVGFSAATDKPGRRWLAHAEAVGPENLDPAYLLAGVEILRPHSVTQLDRDDFDQAAAAIGKATDLEPAQARDLLYVAPGSTAKRGDSGEGRWEAAGNHVHVHDTPMRRAFHVKRATLDAAGFTRDEVRVQEDKRTGKWFWVIRPDAAERFAGFIQEHYPVLAAAILQHSPVWVRDAAPVASPPSATAAPATQTGQAGPQPPTQLDPRQGSVQGVRWEWSPEDRRKLMLLLPSKETSFYVSDNAASQKAYRGYDYWKAFDAQDAERIAGLLESGGAGKNSFRPLTQAAAALRQLAPAWNQEEVVPAAEAESRAKRARSLSRRFSHMLHPDVKADPTAAEQALAKGMPFLDKVQSRDLSADLGAWGSWKVVGDTLYVDTPFIWQGTPARDGKPAIPGWADDVRTRRRRPDSAGQWFDTFDLKATPAVARALDRVSPPLAMSLRLALLTEVLGGAERDCASLEDLASARSVEDIADAKLAARVRQISAAIPWAPGIRPFPYQEVGIAYAVASGGRALIGDSMGLGKTPTAIGYLLTDVANNTPALVIAPTTYNWAREIDKFTGGRLRGHVVTSRGPLPRFGQGDVALVSWGLVRTVYERLLTAGFKTVVADECFPGSALVMTPEGERPIRALQPGDVVLSCDTTTGAVLQRRIVQHFRNPNNTLIDIFHEKGCLTCTHNHKIWTHEDGYVEARHLVGRHLRILPGHGNANDLEREEASPLLQSELRGSLAGTATRRQGAQSGDRTGRRYAKQGTQEARRCSTDADAESDARYSDAPENGWNAAIYRTSSERPRGKWGGVDGAAGHDSQCDSVTTPGTCRDSPSAVSDDVWTGASALQDRSGRPGPQAGDRDRWAVALHQEGARSEEGTSLGLSRVVRVAVHECDSSGRTCSRCGRDSLVDTDLHDLEIEETHSYFVHGVLVSNCHYMKNVSGRGEAARILLHSAPHRLLLSGTAIENRPIELWHQLHAIDEHTFPEKKDFGERFAAATQRTVGGKTFWDDRGASNLDELRDVLRCYVIRRTKSEVLLDLPEKSRQSLTYDLEPSARKAYEEVAANIDRAICAAWRARSIAKARKMVAEGATTVSEAVAAVNRAPPDAAMLSELAIVQLGYLRRAVAEAKVPNAIAWLEDEFLPTGEPLLIFVEHQSTLEALGAALKKLGVTWDFIDGSVNQKDRMRKVDDFQQGRTRILVGSKAMAEGWNLTRASHVMFAERWWVPSKEEQAEDRAYRIGQKNAVTVYYLMAPGTVDDQIASLVDSKRATIEKIMSGERVQQVAAVTEGVAGEQQAALGTAVMARIARRLADGGQCKITVADLHGLTQGDRVTSLGEPDGTGKEDPMMKTETRVWRGAHDGYTTGRGVKIDKQWRVITSAKKAKTRKLTSMDEDMGDGQQGDVQTTQEITHRAATEAEITTAEAKLAAAEQAKREADPAYLRDQFGGTSIGETSGRAKEIAAMKLAWTEHARTKNNATWSTATMPDGRQVGRFVSGYDDYRTTYSEHVPQDEVTIREAAEVAEQRDKLFARIADSGIGVMRNYTAKHDFGHKQYGDPAAIDDPRTPAERAALAAGARVDAVKQDIRERMPRILETGIVTPEDFAAAQRYLDLPKAPPKPGQSIVPRAVRDLRDNTAAPGEDEVMRVLDSTGIPMYGQLDAKPIDRLRPRDLAIEAGLARADASRQLYPTPWDGLLPPRPGHSAQRYVYFGALRELARSRGTLASYAERIDQEQHAVLVRGVADMQATSKKNREALVRRVAESASPAVYDVRVLAELGPDVFVGLPKGLVSAATAKMG